MNPDPDNYKRQTFTVDAFLWRFLKLNPKIDLKHFLKCSVFFYSGTTYHIKSFSNNLQIRFVFAPEFRGVFSFENKESSPLTEAVLNTYIYILLSGVNV